MTPQERARIMRMRARKLRHMGKPKRVLPHEYARVLAMVQRAQAAGMAQRDIAAQVGLNDRSTIQQMMSGHLLTVSRETYDRLLTLRIVEEVPPGITNHKGAKMSPVPTQRKLRALCAAGFPARTLAPLFGENGTQPSWMRYMLNADNTHTYAATAAAADKLYQKLRDVSPLDYGVAPQFYRKAKLDAARKGWAPPSAWDDDTINDPDAIAEFTGACGTEEGYRIHVRETIVNNNPLPLCAPCKQAVETREFSADDYVFDTEAFIRITKEKGLSFRQLAPKLGCHQDTIYRWKLGERSPQTRAKLNSLAVALDCDPEELINHDATEEGREREAVKPGQFNPYILRAVIAATEFSYNSVARIPGMTVTGPSVAKWARGENRPQRETIKPIADYFGVSVEEFYK